MHLTLAWSGLYHCQAVYEANGCCCHVNGIKFISKLLYISGSETVVRDPKWGHGAILLNNDGPRRLMTTFSTLKALIILSLLKHH